MFGTKLKPSAADEGSSWVLIHRLLTEQAMRQWRRYALAFAMMGIAAAATALGKH